MSHTRCGLNIVELLVVVIIMVCGVLCGLGIAHLLGAGGFASFAWGCGGGFLFPFGTAYMLSASARSERRMARREILVRARQALRAALRENGKEVAEADAEVDRQLPDTLLEDAMR